ncbi:NADH-quinone oxidoreductase subunit L [Polynucleobacter sp. IMCC30063]|uniref:NADH-quinone oxidoreductase subunit L n=1 Tax=unclassified Polynucleobacter TaxID=2640945 RepID=UPI001F177C50|nr:MULTISPECIES: NADH-quinone oxidoreductase subunit L [unclassified Polynucleobacter]MCE7505829.1 NADH-quinone oxidoreductase subunit L [Polynucleobacter sp. IMCC30063]MCE7527023.1 NADH-quinone oxidoreductase subunit L [Polynucleobacter sp. IMCC 30228]
MQTNLTLPLLCAIPLAPLIGAIITGFFGTALFGNRLSKVGSQSLAIMGVIIAFALSCQVFFYVQAGDYFNGEVYTWMQLGELNLGIGFLIDSLTATMMVVVTFVSLMVHIYTIGYMHGEEGYNRFFSYISLFTFAMLMLVMSNNLLQLFFGWEAVGVVSYLLIGFYFERQTAVFANMKAFLVNRVGDFGFILGIGLILAYTGSMNYDAIFAQNTALAAQTLPGTSWNLMTVICICLFIGAMGKSAQFPLHVWLPDSMEGPTPISALIHAATMVTAGIFMVSRMSPLFELSTTALSFILVIGSITALFMGFLGIVQNDIKRVVAYSTLSQLGFMTIALGVSAYPVAIFHLMTHAFFKALLFLAAGSVIMGMHHEQDMRKMGGLWKYMPITCLMMLIGSLSLIGTPFFSGFYSKDSIIEAVAASDIPGSGFAYFAVMVSVFITALYSFRLYFYVFHGKERFHQPSHAAHQAEHHDEHADIADHHGLAAGEVPHESPWVVTVPLILLAIPSVIIGFYAIEPMLFGDFFGDSMFIDLSQHPVMEELANEFHGPIAMALHALTSSVTILVALGVLTAALGYLWVPSLPSKIAHTFAPLKKLLDHKYYLDELNQLIFAKGSIMLGRGLWHRGDQRLIDGLLVNGSAHLVSRMAGVMRHLQSGYLYHYAFAMILGLAVLLAWVLYAYLPYVR